MSLHHIAKSLIVMELAFGLLASNAIGAEYPAPKEGSWTAKDFKFHTGDVIDIRLHYRTVGEPTGIPVVVLHGTGGSGASMLTPSFAGELFGEGQPLDAKKYFVILPDAVGHGKSSKPSDGLKTRFPAYNYADMVDAQYRLVAEGLGIKHVRLVLGNSMGGMNAWLWGTKYPNYVDAIAPMASQPTPMAARNYMMRKIMLETIRQDPEYANGNYTKQPGIVKYASIFYSLATAGGTLNFQKLAPTAAQADRLVTARLAAPFPADANDFVWAWQSSADYDPSPDLEKIEARVLAINAADDERNPPETGIMERELKRVKNGRLLLIPASEETRGHAATAFAKFYKRELAEFLASVPKRGK
jgi:homoserine O-acetyltransferase